MLESQEGADKTKLKAKYKQIIKMYTIFVLTKKAIVAVYSKATTLNIDFIIKENKLAHCMLIS